VGRRTRVVNQTRDPIVINLKSFCMSDNKNKVGGQDRDRVAGGQEYEIDYLIKKLGVTREQVLKAIAAVGNDRDKVEQYLKKK